MKMRSFILLLIFAVLMAAASAQAFALEPGAYTGYMATSYCNPDTGKVDDGGTANAALGEGMCRSATAESCLVEKDADGNVWLTVRLLLQSNCSNVALYTRSAYDSYSEVSYEIIAEDSAQDSIDYRFKVSDPGVKLKGTMYVSPMGRDVLWYMHVDTSTLKPGHGDFSAFVEDAPKAAEQAVPAEGSAADVQPGSAASAAQDAAAAQSGAQVLGDAKEAAQPPEGGPASQKNFEEAAPSGEDFDLGIPQVGGPDETYPQEGGNAAGGEAAQAGETSLRISSPQAASSGAKRAAAARYIVPALAIVLGIAAKIARAKARRGR